MRGIFELLNRFRADERGVFAVVFGLMAIVLVAMAGAAVDYTSLENARARTQIALDSAALGLQPKIFATVPPTTADCSSRSTDRPSAAATEAAASPAGPAPTTMTS